MLEEMKTWRRGESLFCYAARDSLTPSRVEDAVSADGDGDVSMDTDESPKVEKKSNKKKGGDEGDDLAEYNLDDYDDEKTEGTPAHGFRIPHPITHFFLC